jgi:probable HAF family extracellular repeat protein
MVHEHAAARMSRGIAVLLAIAATATSARAQNWGSYGVTVHPTPQQQFFNNFLGVSNSGDLHGNSSSGQAAIFSQTGGVVALPAPSGAFTASALAVNNVGQSAGYANFNNGQHAVVWSGNAVQDIGTLGGQYSFAYGMNDLGQVVGNSTTSSNGGQHAFLWSPSGMLDLGVVGGGTYSSAYAVNNAGQVAGSAGTASGQQHAAVWINGVGQDLGTLGGSYSIAYGINSSGQVAGQASTVGNSGHAFLWSGNVLQDLGTLGGTYSEAFGVSDAGQVIGGAYNSSNVYMAALWEQTGGVYQAYDLASIVNDGVTNSGWVFTAAQGISTNGDWVLAYGQNNQLGYSGWVALEAGAPPVTATPEPASMSLMATGLFGMAGWARRRKAATKA